MADVTISYKGNEIATMSDSGVKTLLTGSAFCEDDITVSYTKPSGGGGATTVSFDNDCIFKSGGSYISYIDGNGDYQNTGTLAELSAVSYQMLSGSLLVWADATNPAMTGYITGTPVGITLVDSKTITMSRSSVYFRYYQVD